MNDETLTIETGPIHYRLDIPALDLPHYLRLQAVVWRRLLLAHRRQAWGNSLLSCVGGGLIGGLGAFAAARFQLDIQLWAGFGEEGGGWLLEGFGMLMLGLGLFLVLLLALRLVSARQARWQLRVLHESNRNVLGAHELLVAEKGIGWRNPGQTFFHDWSQITGLQPQGDMTFIIADQISALGLPEAVLNAMPDRQGFLAFLRARIPG